MCGRRRGGAVGQVAFLPAGRRTGAPRRGTASRARSRPGSPPAPGKRRRTIRDVIEGKANHTPETGGIMASKLRARDIMSGGAHCVGAHESLKDAAKMMRDLDVGCLPICGDNNKLTGLIIDRDI